MKIASIPMALGLGVLGTAGLFLTLGAAQTAGTVKLVLSGPVEILGYPQAQDMRRIVEGTPFTVPAGKILVVSGLAVAEDPVSSDPNFIRISFGGIEVLDAQTRGLLIGAGSVTGTGPSIAAVPPGLTAPAGTQVTVTANFGAGVVLGYLVDA